MASTSTLPPLLTIAPSTAYAVQPLKRIFNGDDIPSWLASEAYTRIMTVLVRCNAAVRGQRGDAGTSHSDTVAATTSMLDRVSTMVDEVPLQTGPQRFGNLAFRDFAALLSSHNSTLQSSWLPESHTALLPELEYYFSNAFGNSTRIDYGSGHELAFLAYLTVLRYTGLLSESDEKDMVLVVFRRYLEVCRKLQAKFNLEPAGSKGVWGLEDHQFLNFLWGSSQLIGQSEITPSHILDLSRIPSSSSTAQSETDGYLFLSSIQHIHTLKRGPFNEHSPILYSIATTVPNWQKVNSGLVKMYQAEVLEKHPVVQHFWFGGILPWKRAGSEEELPESSGAGKGGLPEEDEETGEEDVKIGSSSSTPAPWARVETAPSASSSQSSMMNPMASTAAPWASQASTASLPPVNTVRPPSASSALSPSSRGYTVSGPTRAAASSSRQAPSATAFPSAASSAPLRTAVPGVAMPTESSAILRGQPERQGR